jgi:hypothetical protein
VQIISHEFEECYFIGAAQLLELLVEHGDLSLETLTKRFEGYDG